MYSRLVANKFGEFPDYTTGSPGIPHQTFGSSVLSHTIGSRIPTGSVSRRYILLVFVFSKSFDVLNSFTNLNINFRAGCANR